MGVKAEAEDQSGCGYPRGERGADTIHAFHVPVLDLSAAADRSEHHSSRVYIDHQLDKVQLADVVRCPMSIGAERIDPSAASITARRGSGVRQIALPSRSSIQCACSTLASAWP
jgi:hypothetical protein